MPLLEVHDIHVSYGGIVALRGISFTVEVGTVVALIGANGAGKSTTLNTLSGLVRPRAGSIHFEGRDITGWRPDRISTAGLVQVPEGRQVIATMSVLENLEAGVHGRPAAQTQAELEAIFERFPRLKERRKQKAGSLSGGEQQMLAVGRALMMRPKLLMLDEPSMGLAPLLVNEVFEIIRAIRADGVTILLVEQNARKALALADWAYVLERGVIQQQGPAADLRRDSAIIAAYLGK
jgi:branched-chain amino acid transport system ATP-binding protein